VNGTAKPYQLSVVGCLGYLTTDAIPRATDNEQRTTNNRYVRPKCSLPDLHYSQIHQKSSYALMQQSLLNFRFQNAIFHEKPEAGAHHPELVNNPTSVLLGTK